MPGGESTPVERNTPEERKSSGPEKPPVTERERINEYVQAVLADVNSHVHSGLIHGILSLSYELKQLSSPTGPQPLQPFSLLTTQNGDALTHGRIAVPRRMRASRHCSKADGHRPSSILFAFPIGMAIATPVAQEQECSLSKTD